MTARRQGADTTGLLSPVALSGAIALLTLSPLMRGGNRHAALIVLEGVALAALLALAWRSTAKDDFAGNPGRIVLVLALSPLLLAIIQLLPLPPALWTHLPGQGVYADTLRGAGMATLGWKPLSVNPPATAASLLAGLPVSAAFLMGYLATRPQLRLMLIAVTAIAFAQVALGLMQVAGGEQSPLYFGAPGGRAVGSFANSNHFANYLVMSLIAFIWLAYDRSRQERTLSRENRLAARNRLMLAAAGGVMLVVGVLLSQSRGAALFGLSTAVLALAVVTLRVKGLTRGGRAALLGAVLLVLAAVAIIGIDAVTARSSARELANSAGFRALLARTSLEAAFAFFPFGSGWGTYDQVYPRFKPAAISGFANHAHMDYVEMLLEGGIFFVALALAFAWLAGQRAALLVRTARRDRKLGRDAMASALCGLGLLALLLHALVEFNMRIPANAILGALLAGAYLRPFAAARADA